MDGYAMPKPFPMLGSCHGMAHKVDDEGESWVDGSVSDGG